MLAKRNQQQEIRGSLRRNSTKIKTHERSINLGNMKTYNFAVTLLLTCCGSLPSAQSMDYRYFVAGGTCAAISHGITTPIDVIKTRIQANPEKYSKGMKDATLTILKEDGPDALLGGLGPTVVGYGIEGM